MQYITKTNEISNFIKDLSTTKLPISFDIETTGLDCFSDKLILIQVKIDENIYIFDCRILGIEFISYICKLLEPHTLIGHNIKFDLKFIKVSTGVLFLNIFDTMIAERLITNGIGEKMSSLLTLVNKYTNIILDKQVRKEFYSGGEINITQEILIYSSEDVNYLFDIMQVQQDLIEKQKQTRVMELENMVLPVVASMELNGVLIDVEQWRKLSAESQEIINGVELDLKNEIINKLLADFKFENALKTCEFIAVPVKGVRFGRVMEGITDATYIRDYLINHLNLGSPQQMLYVLQKLYKVGKRDSRGKFKLIESTNEKIINKYLVDFEIIRKLLTYREHSKKVESFGEKFLENINPKTGRIHSDFYQVGAQSGRFSSSSPNLCNIPKEAEYRSPFIARPGYKTISSDFSQEELRLMGMFEPKMAQAFREDKDLHLVTASFLFNKPMEEIVKDERTDAKNVSFAVGYGSTEWGLYKNFGIPIEKGVEYLDNYFNKVYTSLRDAIERAGKYIQKNGFSKTMYGRVRYFPSPSILKDGDTGFDYQKKIAENTRQGFNHITQGTGADIIKMALCDIFYNNPFGEDFKILIQVYDEIVVEVKEDIVEKAAKFIEEKMLKAESYFLDKMEIPSKVDQTIADCWSK